MPALVECSVWSHVSSWAMVNPIRRETSRSREIKRGVCSCYVVNLSSEGRKRRWRRRSVGVRWGKKRRKYSCLVFDKYIGYVWFRGSKPCVNISDTSHLLFRLKVCFCTPQRHSVLSACPRKYLLSIFCFCFISPPWDIDLFQSCFKNVCVRACVRVCASVSQERWKRTTKLCWKRKKDFLPWKGRMCWQTCCSRCSHLEITGCKLNFHPKWIMVKNREVQK